MEKILLVTPAFLQPNSPYPANSYLKGYLHRRDIDAEQFDLSIETLNALFSREWLKKLFSDKPDDKDPNTERIYSLRTKYIDTVDTVMTFLRTGESGLANLLCMPDYLPQASRFETIADIETMFGSMGIVDCAKYISTFFLQDLSDYIRATVTPHFEIVKYAEKLSVALPEFDLLQAELESPLNLVEEAMIFLLDGKIKECNPTFVSFTIPFPGNLLPSLRCAQFVKREYPNIKTICGGGYPSTELRQMSDKGIFDYFDFIILDDGELALESAIKGGELLRTYTKDGFHDNTKCISHLERGCPDYSDLPHKKYFSLLEVTNPMHRLWSDGSWNKMTLAHGCYWSKCAFCDTSLDYIKRYDSLEAGVLVDWMEQISNTTGSRSFHFTDEAASPKLLRDISIEMIRRGSGFSWWTNIRFEAAFTGDLCRLMASAGCIAVAGGLETASDRLLSLINKGVTIEQTTIALRNLYYSGIMAHTYLMYGFPTQTLQESVDSLEVVRQLFRAELIGSAFWHRYAMTIHSPSGINPEEFGVKRKNTRANSFANNEIYFAEDRGYNINLVGDALRAALADYMTSQNISRPAHKWFAGKSLPTTIENSLITDHLIKPDSSRIYNPQARLVWIGPELKSTEEGLTIFAPAETKDMKFNENDAKFLVDITKTCSDLSKKITFEEVKQIYSEYSNELFSTLYHSKKWDKLREYGLLQL